LLQLPVQQLLLPLLLQLHQPVLLPLCPLLQELLVFLLSLQQILLLPLPARCRGACRRSSGG
jgi:hypothetical protein